MIQIRPATENDIEAITKIYNQAVIRTTATFDTEEKTNSERLNWLREHGTTHPVLVAVENEVVGWASLSKWSERCAYDSTVELSVYIDENFRGKGIGRKLLRAITKAGKEKKFHTIIARITSDNLVSIKIHEEEGYVYTGVLKEAGKKFGKFLDVLFFQLIFKEDE